MRAEIIFRWFDFYVGLYFDRRNRTLYVFPVPMFGLKIRFSFRCCYCNKPVTPKQIDAGKGISTSSKMACHMDCKATALADCIAAIKRNNAIRMENRRNAGDGQP